MMMLQKTRRLLFDHLTLNLAMVLGGAQALLWHWSQVVAWGRDGPGPAATALLTGLLVLANCFAVPALRRHRRRRDWSGRVARLYMDLGVATLLMGVTVAATWFLFLLSSGLLGALGASAADASGPFRVLSIGAVGSVAGMLAWGFSFGRRQVARTRLRVDIPDLHPDLSGLRIVHISDLHIGNGLEGRRLAKMIERTNALDPDVIVLTGDVFDFDPSVVDDGVRELASLHARFGVYVILGNHDCYTGVERVALAFARLAPELRLLRDEVVTLPVARPLHLAGVEDSGRDWSGRSLQLAALEAVAAARPAEGPTLLLVHRPEAFPQASRLGFPLVLAGHTHGGQLALPTPGGRYNLASFVTRFTRGLYRLGSSTLYVNRGLGMGGPSLRFNCSREIATIELVAAAS